MVNNRPAPQFPFTPPAFLIESAKLATEITRSKNTTDLAWYPFDSLTALPLVTELLAPCFDEVRAGILAHPVLDLGCADGDLAILFALLGANVDAIDSQATNFNRMEGVRALNSTFGVLAGIYNLDLDAKFDFHPRYGLTLFLGTLYHLKNPYYVLENLAFHTEWCVLSTRIAKLTPRNNNTDHRFQRYSQG